MKFLLMITITTLGPNLKVACTSVSSYTTAAVIYHPASEDMYQILTA